MGAVFSMMNCLVLSAFDTGTGIMGPKIDKIPIGIKFNLFLHHSP
jgi:hypothetical protein